ncbi:TIR domain-containing protein [Bradyrhizobium septentrionale]|uniref:TIR domain-containing protein n=1 Tax=Bradyrhizobium septentrionale TaxID=1404411 RepID=A0A973W6D5_9BRAD|nr:TIR domain-containing protein [Bradyrhizobium septentrionale]UGY16756.1 TIR domain-containing protein [Bradyrhizobium septentrionale]
MSKRRNVFISHHHADDEHVGGLTKLLDRQGFQIRNSSIRAKPSNQVRLDKKQVPEATLKRLLRMKMSWASTVIVLIGKETHQRPWVDWEIRKANELGKRIVGVFTRGGTEADIPPAFEEYGDTLVNWNSDSVIQAIEGTNSPFESPGSAAPRELVHASRTSRC